MLKLSNSTTETKEVATALGAGDTSRAFRVQHGFCLVTLTGTFDSETVTMQHSPTGLAADFTTFVTRDSTGLPTNVTYTQPLTDLLLAHGQTFRFVCTSGGGAPDIDIFVAGDGVILE